jgi:hypothetical protein
MRQLKIMRLTILSTGACIASLFVCSGSFAQSPAQELALKDQFTAYSRQALQEKLYLHTDKDFYVAGEICWFKIYNTDASFNMPLGISKLAYIEVFDKNNKPVLQAKVALNGGNGNGSLQWPVSMSSGKYLLRAYTSWMKNFDAAYFFEKPLTIINTRKIYTDSSTVKKDNYHVGFYPEGGNMVNGLQSTIAFKITDQYGKGVPGTGVVVTEKNDTIASFATARFGMGNFLFTPEQTHSYKAIINISGNKWIEQILPVAYPGGYVMHLSKENNRQLKITVRSAAANESSAFIYLFVHTRGIAKIAAAAEIRGGSCFFLVDTGRLGEGISQFTIFNAARQPVCERLFFKKPSQLLELTASSDKEVYEPRSKVTMHLGTSNGTGKLVPADMSMAVVRVDTLTATGEMDITNYLWLCSDLVGDIESPGYYFSDPADPAAQAADNLMLTQGWRRFRWEDILQHKTPEFRFAPEYKGHIVRGKVVMANGSPAKGIESFLAVPGTKTQFRDAFSDDSGVVKFEMSNFYGNDEIIVQTTGQEDGLRHIDITSPFAEKYPVSVLQPFSLPATQAAALTGLHMNVQVQNAYLFSKLKQVLPPATDTTAFYSKPDNAYWLDDYVRFTTVEEILREYVPDVNVRKRNGKFQLPVFDNIRKEFFRVSPLILLDGVPVLDADKIMSYDPLKIKKLEVLARMYFYGNMFFGGIVNFITYKGDIPGFELDPHATVIDYGTVQMQREFFSPSYETPQLAAGRLPDFRTLLYWSPDIKPGVAGKNETVFYTSDLPGRFAAIVEGIAGDGKTGSKTIFFTVKEKDALAGNK